MFFGVAAVAGTAFVQTGRLSWLGLAASVPAGLLSCALLMVNNLRDIGSDATAGKRTLAVRIGDSRARLTSLLFLLVPFVLAALIAVYRPFALLTLLALPLAFPPPGGVRRGLRARADRDARPDGAAATGVRAGLHRGPGHRLVAGGRPAGGGVSWPTELTCLKLAVAAPAAAARDSLPLNPGWRCASCSRGDPEVTERSAGFRGGSWVEQQEADVRQAAGAARRRQTTPRGLLRGCDGSGTRSAARVSGMQKPRRGALPPYDSPIRPGRVGGRPLPDLPVLSASESDAAAAPPGVGAAAGAR